MSFLSTIPFILTHPLGSQNKVRTIIRYLGWQLRSRISRNYHIVSWVNDSKLLIKHGDTGLTGNIYVGLHEFQDMGFLLHYLRPDDIFVDIGANAGSFSVLASKVVGSNTIAIEPIPETFQRLESNIRLNAISNKVKAFNIGLSDVSGILKFTCNLDCMNHVVHTSSEVDKAFKSIFIDVDTLDSVVADEKINLIKIDVEGYELPVLYGAKKTLSSKSLDVVIMEINNSSSLYGYKYMEAVEILNLYSYDCFKYDPMSRKLIKISITNEINGNLIFIKNLSTVQCRLANAIRYRVNGVLF